MPQKNVLLYGNSILLNGLAAQMQSRADVMVHRRSAQAELAALSAVDTVIVDMNEMPLAEVLAILTVTNAGKIIGLDHRCGTATVLLHQVFQASTLDDVGNYL
jgi:predicted methyltransferase